MVARSMGIGILAPSCQQRLDSANIYVARRLAVYSDRRRSNVEESSTKRELDCLYPQSSMLLGRCDEVTCSAVDNLSRIMKVYFSA